MGEVEVHAEEERAHDRWEVGAGQAVLFGFQAFAEGGTVGWRVDAAHENAVTRTGAHLPDDGGMISTCIGGDFRQFEERRLAVRGRFGLRRRAGGAEVRIRFGRGWREVRRVVARPE